MIAYSCRFEVASKHARNQHQQQHHVNTAAFHTWPMPTICEVPVRLPHSSRGRLLPIGWAPSLMSPLGRWPHMRRGGKRQRRRLAALAALNRTAGASQHAVAKAAACSHSFLPTSARTVAAASCSAMDCRRASTCSQIEHLRKFNLKR